MTRISNADAARLGLPVPKGGKRANKPTPTPLWSAWGIPEPWAEYRFDRKRLWRFDFVWIREGVALEIDGGIWIQGRHSRGKGQINDMAKLNRAALLGFRVLRCTPQQLKSGEIMPTIREALGLCQDSCTIGNTTKGVE